MTSTSNRLLAHLQELRKRLLRSVLLIAIMMVVAFMSFDWILLGVLRLYPQPELYMTKIFEGFLTKFKLAGIIGIALASPWWLVEIIAFVIPGLKRKERVVLVSCLSISLILAILGGAFGYRFILPISLTFLSSQGFLPEGVGVLLSYEHSVFYAVKFLVICMVMFQLPVILELLMIFNLMSRKALFKMSRYLIVELSIVARLIHDADALIA